MAGVVCCRLGGGSGSLLCEMGGISKESGAVAGDRSAGNLRGRIGDVLYFFGGGLSADALVCDIQPDPDLYSRAVIHLFANSLTLTATIAGIICLAFAGVNFYVYELRARPIYPWDIFSLGTAAVVAEDYQIVACIQLIASYLIFVILHQLVTFLPKESERSAKKAGANAAVAACLVLIYAYGIFPQFSTSIWAVIFNNAENGTVASFISYLPWAFLEKPEGYGAARQRPIWRKWGRRRRTRAGRRRSILS